MRLGLTRGVWDVEEVARVFMVGMVRRTSRVGAGWGRELGWLAVGEGVGFVEGGRGSAVVWE